MAVPSIEFIGNANSSAGVDGRDEVLRVVSLLGQLVIAAKKIKDIGSLALVLVKGQIWMSMRKGLVLVRQLCDGFGVWSDTPVLWWRALKEPELRIAAAIQDGLDVWEVDSGGCECFVDRGPSYFQRRTFVLGEGCY